MESMMMIILSAHMKEDAISLHVRASKLNEKQLRERTAPRFTFAGEKETNKQMRISMVPPDSNKLGSLPKPATQKEEKDKHRSLHKSSQHTQSFKKHKGKLPEILDPRQSKKEVNFLQQATKATRSMPIREQTSYSTLDKHKLKLEIIRRPYPSKSMKIPFKELIPIKEISKERKIENLKLIRTEFQLLVNTSNHITVRNEDTIFRAYVEKGNNGILIKELLKKRWWWHLEDDPNKANLIWTEWFNKAATTGMKCEEVKLGSETEYVSPTNQDANIFLQPKINSIKMLVDQITFSKVKNRISIGEGNYFKVGKNLKAITNLANKSVTSGQSDIKQVNLQSKDMIHNHIDGCLQLHSKKLLFKNFCNFMRRRNEDPFKYIPQTYYIDRIDCPALSDLYAKCDENEQTATNKNVWIIKPGQNSNRGFGISVHGGQNSLQSQIQKRLAGGQEAGRRGIIVQKYMEQCFLINKRKFDLRCYILITTVNGCLKGYWYNDGYIRTSSEEFDLEDVGNVMVHLTNDAVQKKNASYGKYEDYNKMSFPSFRKYLSRLSIAPQRFTYSYDRMKTIAQYLIASISSRVRRKQYTFELFGLDFMLDNELKPFLIQANSNPCLETSGVILGKLIPEVIDNVLMTAVDPIFPPPTKSKPTKEFIAKDYFRSNKFELIFHDQPLIDFKKQDQLP